MAYYFCRFEETPTTRLCAGIIEEVYQRTGYLPGPGFDSAAHAQLSGRDQATYVFQHAYHTTYVFGLYLCAAARYNQQPKRVAVARHDTRNKSARNHAVILAATRQAKHLLKSRFAVSSSGRLGLAEYYARQAPLPYLTQLAELVQPQAHWLRELSQRSWPETDRGRLLLDALIIGFSRDYHLEQLVDVLCVGLTHFPTIAHEFLVQEAVGIPGLAADGRRRDRHFLLPTRKLGDQAERSGDFPRQSHLSVRNLPRAAAPAPHRQPQNRPHSPKAPAPGKKQQHPLKAGLPAGPQQPKGS